MNQTRGGYMHEPYSFLCIVLWVLISTTAGAANRSRITAIDNQSWVRLPGSTHPAVASAKAVDLGRVDPGTRLDRMVLVLGPSDDIQPALHAFIDSLHDKRSPNYHRWLTPQQFGERFGPSQADMDKIAAWLEQQGFHHIKVASGRGHIEFSGTSQLAEYTFHTEIHSYRHGSQQRLANTSDIAVPKALAGIVRGVNLQNFSFSQPALTQAVAIKRDQTTGRWEPITPTSSFSNGYFLDPHDFAKIYDLDRIYDGGNDGSGQTIAIVSRKTIDINDVETFRQVMKLPRNDPNMIVDGPPASASDPFNYPEMAEAALDTEWAGAVAPGATIDLVSSPSTATTDGVALSSAYIVNNNLADVVSVSFGMCEQNMGPMNQFFNALWQQAAAQGISVFVASGDSGAAGCDATTVFSPAQNGLGVNGLASTPFNTAVGGTQFNDSSNYSQFWDVDVPKRVTPIGYIPESVWNESCNPAQDLSCTLAATGGGVSKLYAKPAWQSTNILGVPNDGARDIPDISLTAAGHNGYIICVTSLAPCTTTVYGDETYLLTAVAVGGTSASSPSFAGIMALINQKEGGRQGLANYGLYRLAAQENFANCNSAARTDPTIPAPAGCVFNDVTTGNNGVPGNDITNNPAPDALGYPATAGYDLAAGLGSVDAFKLISAWNSAALAAAQTSLSATSSTSVQHGQAVTFTISVTSASGNGAPTGSVGLIAKTDVPFSTGVGLGGGTLVGGALTTTVNALPGGQYAVVAHYPGDSNFAPSDSDPVLVNVGPEPSSLAIIGYDASGHPQPSPLDFGYGDPFVIELRVTPASGLGSPAGVITLFDGGEKIAELPLGSTGSTTVRNCVSVGVCLGFGSHSLTATYSGDPGLNPAVAEPFIFSISKAEPVTGMALGCTPIDCIIQFGFFQSTLPIFPTGNLAFTDTVNGQTTILESLEITRDAIYERIPLPPGNHVINAQYSGDDNFLPKTVGPVSVTIPQSAGLPAQITVTPLTDEIVVGQPIAVSVQVRPAQPGAGVPSGNVYLISQVSRLFDNPQTQLTDGSVTVREVMPNTGPIFGGYLGDSTFAPVAADPLRIKVEKATPRLSVKSNLAVASPGQQVTFSAAVAPPPHAVFPTGTVQFYDSLNGAAPVPYGDPHMLATNSMEVGTAKVAIPAKLPLGTHAFTAAYSGDLNYNVVSADSSIPVTVNVVESVPPNATSPEFGSVDAGSTSSVHSVTATFSASGILSGISVRTQGVVHSDFEFVGPGSCTTGIPFTAGQSCYVDVAFAPDFAGERMGAVVLTDAGGNLLGTQYISGFGEGPQIAFGSSGPVPAGNASDMGLKNAQFLAADSSGYFFVADNGPAGMQSPQVFKLPPRCSNNTCKKVIASSANGLRGANGVAVDGVGNLYLSDIDRVVMIPPGCSTASCTKVIAGPSSGQSINPRQLAVDGAGNLFIADLDNSRVLEIPAGCGDSSCQQALGSGLNQVFGVAVDNDGDIFVSDFNGGRVVKLPPGCTDGGCQTTVATGLVGPKGIRLDAAGNLYVAESAHVVEISAADGSLRTVMSPDSWRPQFDPTDVAVGVGGSLLVADAAQASLWQMDRWSPPVFSFSLTALNSVSDPQSQTVENIGTRPLSLTSVATTTNATLVSPSTCKSGTVLAPGATCSLVVAFAPATVGNAVTAQISFVDNNLNQPDATQTTYLIGSANNGRTLTQTITFPVLPNPVKVGISPIALEATASSGLPVSYTVSGPASVSGSTLTILGFGSVNVTATQAGDATYFPAAPVSQMVTVLKQAQTVTFPALPSSVTFGVAPIALLATASSGLPITYTSSGPASVSGSTLILLGAGSVTVTANQVGNGNYDPATPVSQTMTVNLAENAGFSLAASTQTLVLRSGQSGTLGITVTPSGGFDSEVRFSCAQQQLTSCSFHPASVTPLGAPVDAVLAVTASNTAAGVRKQNGSLQVLAACIASLMLGVLVLSVPRGVRTRRKGIAIGLVLLAAFTIVFLEGCGGSSQGGGGSNRPKTESIVVSATAGNLSRRFTLTVTITP